MTVKIDIEKCIGCGLCIEVCPTHAAYNNKGKTYIDETRCNLCGACHGMCIVSALTFEQSDNDRKKRGLLQGDPLQGKKWG